jgi:hypothetical protein
MSIKYKLIRNRLSNWLAGILACGLLVMGASVAFREVTFHTATVLEIVQIPGKDLSERMLIVESENEVGRVRTSDMRVWPKPGDQICISNRTLWGSWSLIGVALPNQCS